jgi:hypothetical protein
MQEGERLILVAGYWLLDAGRWIPDNLLKKQIFWVKITILDAGYLILVAVCQLLSTEFKKLLSSIKYPVCFLKSNSNKNLYTLALPGLLVVNSIKIGQANFIPGAKMHKRDLYP